MSHKTDTWIRLALLLAAGTALAASFRVAASDLDRPSRFGALLALALIVAAAGSLGIDVIQGYTKRRPLRLRGGKPRLPLMPTKAGPKRELPTDWQVAASLSTPRLVAGLSASLAMSLVFGAVGYALAGSATENGAGLLVYLLAAVAIWFTARFTVKALLRRNALRVTPESATIGPGLGYIPALEISRQSVRGIEFSQDKALIAFVTDTRRFEVGTSFLDNHELAGQIAGLWPEVSWHELSPDSQPTKLSWE